MEGEYYITYGNFNPRSPHGERLFQNVLVNNFTRFQSTLPARGATTSSLNWQTTGQFQSTLPARGATERHCAQVRGLLISIHAPRTGSDASAQASMTVSARFQSTLPARGATGVRLFRCAKSLHFNPRSPHGERLYEPENKEER